MSETHADRVARAWLRFCVTHLGFDACVTLLVEMQATVATDATHLDVTTPQTRRLQDARTLLRGAILLVQHGLHLGVQAALLMEGGSL
jgi:hypothetical protein